MAEIAALPGVDRVETEAPFPAYVLADGRPLGGMADRSWGHSWARADAEPAAPVTGRGPGVPGRSRSTNGPRPRPVWPWGTGHGC